MKIIHAAETIKGGVATVLGHLVADQTARADDVTVIIPAAHLSSLQGGEKAHVVTYFRSGRNVASLFRLGLTLFGVLRREQPDVVHLHSTFAGVVGRLVVFANRLTGGGNPYVVYCPHAFPFLMENGGLKHTVYQMVERFLAPLCSAIICTSRFEKDAGVQAGISSRKLHVVYNGVERARLRRSAGKGDQLRLLFVGRLDHQKGFDLLAGAMPLLPKGVFVLDVVGEGVVGDATAWPQAENIVYHGWVPREKLETFYTNADVLVMPSRWESFGLVAAEAQTAGLPVVANRRASLPEVVKDGETGMLADFITPADVAASLKTLTRPKVETWSLAAGALFANLFRVEDLTAETYALYKRQALRVPAQNG